MYRNEILKVYLSDIYNEQEPKTALFTLLFLLYLFCTRYPPKWLNHFKNYRHYRRYYCWKKRNKNFIYLFCDPIFSFQNVNCFHKNSTSRENQNKKINETDDVFTTELNEQLKSEKWFWHNVHYAYTFFQKTLSCNFIDRNVDGTLFSYLSSVRSMKWNTRYSKIHTNSEWFLTLFRSLRHIKYVFRRFSLICSSKVTTFSSGYGDSGKKTTNLYTTLNLFT